MALTIREGVAAVSFVTHLFGTAAQMAARNPRVPKGVLAGESDTGVVKMGDGVTLYNSLAPVLSGTYASVVGIAGTGIDLTGATDSAAAINALLTANPGKTVRGVPGSTYRITAPLVVKSGTTLDMGACTVVLASGSNCNVLQNYAFANPAATATDGAITSGQPTLTTALGAQAVAGQTVTVSGATTGGYTALTTTVSSATSSTITLAANAGATVTGATVTLYTRDSDITIIGGTWDRGSNTGPGGVGTQTHTLLLRHIDGLTVRGAAFKSTAGKYAISIGGCTNFSVSDVNFKSTFSDGVHVVGPSSLGSIRNVFGTAGDDMVALTAQDWTQYGEVCGDITDVSIENVYPNASARAAVKVMGGPGGGCKRIRIRNVFGSVLGTGGAVWIGDDTARPETQGGALDHVSVENLSTSVPNANTLVQLNGTATKNVRFNGVTFDNASSGSAIFTVAPSSAATLGSLTIENLTIPNMGANTDIVYNGPNSTISRFVARRWDITATQAYTALIELQNVVTDLILTEITANFAGTALVFFQDTKSGATCTRATISDLHIIGTGSGSIIKSAATGQGLPRVEVTNSQINALAWLFDIANTTDIHLSGVSLTSPGQGVLNARASAVLTLTGDGNTLGAGSQNIKIASGGKVANRLIDCPPSTSVGGFPTIAAGAGAGTGPTVTVSGSDRAGTITVTPGTSPASGAQATITFAGTWPQTPKIALTPTNAAAQTAGGYLSAKSTTAFTLSSANAAGGSMTFDYVILA